MSERRARLGASTTYRTAYAAGATVVEVVDAALAGARRRAAAAAVLIGEPLADRARADAVALAGVPTPTRLPLYGVPFLVKDNIDVAGVPDHGRLPRLRLRRPRPTPPSVARLRAAGAVVVGKTNLDQFATGLVGTRSPYGSAAERAARRSRPRRLELRLGRRRGPRRGAVLARHRHRRLGSGAGRAQRHRRVEADARPGEHAPASSRPCGASTARRCSPAAVGDARPSVDVIAGADPRDAFSRAGRRIAADALAAA